MTYNDTFMSNSTNILELAQGVSAATNYWFGGFILIGFFIIFFAVFKNYDFKTVFLADCWLSSLLAGLLFFVNMIPAWVIALTVVPLGIAILVKVWGE